MFHRIFENMLREQIKNVKKSLKEEIENIYNTIDENDEKIAQNLKNKILFIPKKLNYMNTPKQFHDEIQKIFNIFGNIVYFTVDKTDDVAGLLKNIFEELLN